MNRKSIGIGIVALMLMLGFASAAFMLSIQQGQAAIVISNGITSGGITPYSYQWFSSCPSCWPTNTLIPGATNTVYYFNTSGATALGLWNFTLQGKDSAANVVNSIVIGVNVISQNSNSMSAGTILLNNSGISVYAPAALLMFAIGMILTVITITGIFGIWKLGKGGFIQGLVLFGIAFAAIVLLAFSGFYQGQLTIPNYTITSSSGTQSVVTAVVSTQQLISIKLVEGIIILFGVVDGIIGALSFVIFMINVQGDRKKKRQKRGDE